MAAGAVHNRLRAAAGEDGDRAGFRARRVGYRVRGVIIAEIPLFRPIRPWLSFTAFPHIKCALVVCSLFCGRHGSGPVRVQVLAGLCQLFPSITGSRAAKHKHVDVPALRRYEVHEQGMHPIRWHPVHREATGPDVFVAAIGERPRGEGVVGVLDDIFIAGYLKTPPLRFVLRGRAVSADADALRVRVS